MGGVRTVAVHVAAGAFNALYRLFCLGKRRDEVLFVSRKADEPSYDYRECGAAFERHGLQPVYLAQRLGARTVLPYAWLALREIYHLARCRVCVVDRYDPIVCLIDFVCEDPSAKERRALHHDFPSEPVVVQLWHAFGAFKKFGYQALDVAEGHATEEALLFKIHRNYSWVVCSGEGARTAFAEAFACPVERVVPLSRPTQRRLKELAADGGNAGVARDANGSPSLKAVISATGDLVADDSVADGLATGDAESASQSVQGVKKPVVLFAPTIRKYDKTAHPVQDLMERSDALFANAPYEVRFALHPLETGREASGGVPQHLLGADYVVTDYSSIVYEAYLLGKRVAFFVPDIEHYLESPGLNVNPLEVCPGLCAQDADELLDKLAAWADDPVAYPDDELERFIDGAFAGSGEDPAEDLATFVCAKLEELC